MDLVVGRALRAHRPPLQGRSCLGRAGGERGLGLGRPQEVRRAVFKVEAVGEGRQGPAGGRGRDRRGARAPPDGARAGGGAAEGEEPGQGQRLSPPLLARPSSCSSCWSTTGIGRLEVHQHLRGRGGQGDGRRPAARGRAVPAPSENRTRRRLHCARRAPRPPRTRRSPPCPRRPRPWRASGLQQITAETDPAKLRQGIAQLEQGVGSVPPEVKPALDLILKRGAGAAGRARERKEVNAMKTLRLAVTARRLPPPPGASAQPIPANPDKLKLRAHRLHAARARPTTAWC